jgi:hypothetical protein
MARITIDEAQAWSEDSKVEIAELDAELLNQVETQVLASLANSAYDTSTWVSAATTPSLVRSIIAMMYTAWWYDKHYAEDSGEANAYSTLLRLTAQANVTGILDGTFVLIGETPTGTGADQPSFYPNDTSSAADPSWGDTSAGDAHFSMGSRF